MIKVLPLTFYLYDKNPRLKETFDHELETYHIEIKPVFNRTGLYYAGLRQTVKPTYTNQRISYTSLKVTKP